MEVDRLYAQLRVENIVLPVLVGFHASLHLQHWQGAVCYVRKRGAPSVFRLRRDEKLRPISQVNPLVLSPGILLWQQYLGHKGNLQRELYLRDMILLYSRVMEQQCHPLLKSRLFLMSRRTSLMSLRHLSLRWLLHEVLQTRLR
jgi:hypothetical protein